jgi:hypothetical protein
MEVLYGDHASRSSSREGDFVTALEAGLLTLGSSYWPTPSQRLPRQWSIPLAFVPDHSGASVRELHPLPSMLPLEQQQRLLVPCYHVERQMSSPCSCDQA